MLKYGGREKIEADLDDVALVCFLCWDESGSPPVVEDNASAVAGIRAEGQGLWLCVGMFGWS
jgi:hypothetical protein